MSENGKRTGFALMDEMEQEQQSGKEKHVSKGPVFYKHALMYSIYRAIDGLDLKLPWIMLAGMFVLVVAETFEGIPGWVSDLAAVIAIAGAVQYVVYIGIRIDRKKKNKE